MPHSALQTSVGQKQVCHIACALSDCVLSEWKQKHLAIAFADSVLGMTGMPSLCWCLQSTLWNSACAVPWACPLACSRDTIYGGEQRHRLKDLAKVPYPCNLENAIAGRR